jgi:hypothetical protein
MAVRNREAKVEGYHLERLILAGRELSRRGIGPTEGKWDVEEAIWSASCDPVACAGRSAGAARRPGRHIEVQGNGGRQTAAVAAWKETDMRSRAENICTDPTCPMVRAYQVHVHRIRSRSAETRDLKLNALLMDQGYPPSIPYDIVGVGEANNGRWN